MPLTRWEPFTGMWSEAGRLHRQMNRLFERFGLDDYTRPMLAVSYPLVNIWENDDNVYAETELPGMSLEQLEIYVTGGDQLSIQGERRLPEADKGVWHRQERGFGMFSRTITLPVAVDAEKVTARLEHGVLLVTLPKSEAAKPKRIAVKAD
jgi:HSP20 family protein